MPRKPISIGPVRVADVDLLTINRWRLHKNVGSAILNCSALLQLFTVRVVRASVSPPHCLSCVFTVGERALGRKKVSWCRVFDIPARCSLRLWFPEQIRKVSAIDIFRRICPFCTFHAPFLGCYGQAFTLKSMPSQSQICCPCSFLFRLFAPFHCVCERWPRPQAQRHWWGSFVVIVF